MKILAFDTSTEYCSVALDLNEDRLHRDVLAERRHSELLLPMIHTVLSDAGLQLSDLDALAFGAGPGSFTGLRIACGVAQGLALATGLPVAGISTLEAVAQQNTADKIVVAIDARMGEIYHAAYVRQTKDNQHCAIASEPALCKPQHAPILPDAGWTGCGSGFKAYGDTLQDVYRDKLSAIHSEQYPHAREIAQLAALRGIDAFCGDPAQAAPVYIRNKVALKESER